jgi:hypothetical protein
MGWRLCVRFCRDLEVRRCLTSIPGSNLETGNVDTLVVIDLRVVPLGVRDVKVSILRG